MESLVSFKKLQAKRRNYVLQSVISMFPCDDGKFDITCLVVRQNDATYLLHDGF